MTARRFAPVHIVLAIECVALLVGLAIPGVRAATARRDAQLAAAEVQRVATVAHAAYASTGVWPDDAAAGEVPRAIARLLPEGFTFERTAYVIDWDHWQLSEDADSYAAPHEFVGVSVTVRDPRLAAELTRQLGRDRLHATLGNRTTIVLADPEHPLP